MTTATAPASAPETLDVADYIAALDYRRRVEDRLDAACRAWLEAKRDTDPAFKTTQHGYVDDYDTHGVDYYYDDNFDTYTYIRISVVDLFPHFAPVLDTMRALDDRP